MRLREILLSSKNASQVSIPSEFLLYQAARAQLSQEVIAPAIADKHVVICDRFLDSTRVYQGKARGWPNSVINWFENVFIMEFPTLTFLLDIEPKVGIHRAKKRLDENDIDEAKFENMDLSFHIKVREGYLELAEKEPERFIVINTTYMEPEEVYLAMIREYEQRIRSTLQKK